MTKIIVLIAIIGLAYLISKCLTPTNEINAEKMPMLIATVPIAIIIVATSTKISYKTINTKELINYENKEKEYNELIDTYEDYKQMHQTYKNEYAGLEKKYKQIKEEYKTYKESMPKDIKEQLEELKQKKDKYQSLIKELEQKLDNI